MGELEILLGNVEAELSEREAVVGNLAVSNRVTAHGPTKAK